MPEPHLAAVASVLNDLPPRAAADPLVAVTADLLRREQLADALCGTTRPSQERVRVVVEALASEIARNSDDEPDGAVAAVAAASHAVAAGAAPGEAVAGAVAAFGVTWAQIAAVLRRAGTARWEIDLLLVRCGLTERQRRWAIDLH